MSPYSFRGLNGCGELLKRWTRDSYGVLKPLCNLNRFSGIISVNPKAKILSGGFAKQKLNFRINRRKI